ncbi:MAG: enoyl-CoA hydratase/isomerase family protein [OM182 bacterium]|nr:MAG: enoyl-CoA hydratase/isomerase family protein [OM182 bacterium]
MQRYTALMIGSDPKQPFQHLGVTADGPIATITMARPTKANALSVEHLAELERAALLFRDEPDVRVVVVTGEGPHFSSGADLDDRPRPDLPLVQRRRNARIGQRAIEAILEMDQITIAAWRGAAMGGGACVATACDLRIGGESCFMQYPEVDLGINLSWKSLPIITALVGPARSKRLVIGAERLDAKTLLDWGILDRLVADPELLPTAYAVAADYAAKPPVAAQMIKQSINQLSNPLGHAIMHMDSDQNLMSAGTSDRKLALSTRQTKEDANFTGD